MSNVEIPVQEGADMGPTQEMIFTLDGAYIHQQGGEAWTGRLVELLGLLGLSEQAVRCILSRMSRKGWLKSRRVSRYSSYSQTPQFLDLLEEAEQRIFQPRCDPWDGRWHPLTYSIPESKSHLRCKLRKRLLWLCFGAVNHGTWISPRDLRAEVEQVVSALRVGPCVDLFNAEH